jgi:hypothetical protein
MPGPRSTNRVSRPDTGSTDPRARKRLQERLDAYKEPTDAMRIAGLWTHRPGSENRKK